jgi:hypothetical protein
VSLAEKLAIESALRAKLAQVQGEIKKETAAINKSAQPWDPNRDRVPLAEAQARADSVAAAFGLAAARPYGGEEPLDYKIRMAKSFQQYAADPSLREVDLTELAAANPTVCNRFIETIYNDAMAYAEAPASVPSCQMREIVRADQSGR